MASGSFWRDESATTTAATVVGALRYAAEHRDAWLMNGVCEALVRFHVRALAERIGTDELRKVVDEIHAALVPVAEPVRRWGIWALGIAQNGREEEQFDACVARSAFAFLLRDHAHDATIARMQEEVDDLDDALVRMIDSYGPIAAPSRPSPIPPGHWWWTDQAPPPRPE